MKISKTASSVLFVALLMVGLPAVAAESSSELEVASELKIPGATLPAGTYDVSVADHLADRAIVKIANKASDKHYLLLTVPSKRVTGTGSSKFLFFKGESSTQSLRGWRTPDHRTLEFAYPKQDAVDLTASSGKPVVAFDPTYDKLPANLSDDDMKVVTLWLVSPKTVTADSRGQGVTAAKLADIPGASDANAGRGSEKGSAPVQTADARVPANRLPRTASSTFELLAGGLALLAGATVLRFRTAHRG